MTQVEAAIKNLEELDLSKYPSDSVIKEIVKFGSIGIIDYGLHPGKKVIRARPNYVEERFLEKAQLNYKPQQFNKTYQRASTPNRTMYYGSVIPEDLDKGDLDNERLIVSVEALKWLRDNTTCGTQKITYSRWEVTKDIRLFGALHKKAYYEASSHTKKIMDDYYAFMKEHPDKEKDSLMANEYLAEEFGKEECDPDYHYLISAHFTEFITSKGFDGVLYPSVRAGGKGFNIAITPDAADNKMKLVLAGECTIYKRFDKSVVDNDTQVILENEQLPFDYTLIQPPVHAGEAACLADLKVRSIDELCKPW